MKKKLKISREKLDSWIKAMESGKYKFMVGNLHDEESNCYCALGVLADVEGIPLEPIETDPVEGATRDHVYDELILRFGFLNGFNSNDRLSLRDVYSVNDASDSFENVVTVLRTKVELIP